MSTDSTTEHEGPADPYSTIHASLLRMRRFMNKPPGGAIALPGHDRAIEFSRISACEAILDLSTKGDVTVSDIADELTLEHSSASRLASECERDGLVSRNRAPQDSRRVLLALTDEGLRVATTAKSMHSVVLDALLDGWTDQDIDDFARLLDRFSESVAAIHHSVTSGEVHDLISALKCGDP